MESIFPTLFPAADKSVWLAQVQKELKDAGTHERMRWHTEEGFTLDPYYTANDLLNLPLATIQQAQKQSPSWLNTPEHEITDDKTDNAVLRNTILRGADALVVKLPQNPDLPQLLNGIKLSETPIFFRFSHEQTGVDEIEFVNRLLSIAPYQLKGGLLTDTGKTTAEVTRLTATSPLFRTICASSHSFHNAGATATQELAFTLATLADAYDKLTEDGLSIDQFASKTLISVSVGTSYFMEIAKIRALQILWHRFITSYNSSIPYQPVFIHCQTSTFYDSVATPYTNLLRATTEAMSAVIGGCDALTVHPYDTISGASSEFSARIARNVPLLLKEESYLDKVTDPSAGSYYTENLTHQLAESAWALFLDVEKYGGFEKAYITGFVQAEIERSYQAKVEAVRNGKTLVGVTKYRSDETSNTLETKQHGFSDSGTLPSRRLAQEFE